MNKKENLEYIVSAWAESNNLVLGQLKVTDKGIMSKIIDIFLRIDSSCAWGGQEVGIMGDCATPH